MSQETAIKIDREYRERGRMPLYSKYRNQVNAQDAYLEIDLQEARENYLVRVYCNLEIGNSVPLRVWNNLAFRFAIPNTLSVDGIDALLSDQEVLNLIQKICDGSWIDWDGSHYVGRQDRAAQEAGEKLGDLIRYYKMQNEIYNPMVVEAQDYLSHDTIDINDGEAIEQAAIRIRETAWKHRVHILGDIEDFLNAQLANKEDEE